MCAYAGYDFNAVSEFEMHPSDCSMAGVATGRKRRRYPPFSSLLRLSPARCDCGEEQDGGEKAVCIPFIGGAMTGKEVSGLLGFLERED